MATQVQGRDAMQFINEQDAATLDRFIERLEFRAKDPTFTAYREAYLELLDLPRVEAVAGSRLRHRRRGARDRRARRIRRHRDRGRPEPGVHRGRRAVRRHRGLGDRVEFVVGDAHALDLPAASFDVAVAHTLVSHVRDPLAVLAEAARVIRPSGSVAVFDGDYSSLTFACDDAPLGEAMERAVQSIIMSSPRVMRELPRLLPKAGLRLMATQAHVYAEAGSSRFLLNLAETYGPLAAIDGPRARGAGGCVARRPAPLRRGRHLLRGLQLLRVRRAASHLTGPVGHRPRYGQPPF